MITVTARVCPAPTRRLSPGPAVPGPAGSPGPRGPQLEHRDVVRFVPVSTAELSRPRRPCPVPLQYRAGRRSRSASESTTAAPNAEHGPYRTTSTCRGEKPCGVPRSHRPSPRPASETARPALRAPGRTRVTRPLSGPRLGEPEPGRRHKGRGHPGGGRGCAGAGSWQPGECRGGRWGVGRRRRTTPAPPPATTRPSRPTTHSPATVPGSGWRRAPSGG